MAAALGACRRPEVWIGMSQNMSSREGQKHGFGMGNLLQSYAHLFAAALGMFGAICCQPRWLLRCYRPPAFAGARAWCTAAAPQALSLQTRIQDSGIPATSSYFQLVCGVEIYLGLGWSSSWLCCFANLPRHTKASLHFDEPGRSTSLLKSSLRNSIGLSQN